ncbi:MAG: ATP-dependent Clp protease adaptor ClpS [Bacteroidales bacterium]|nr:ATP-dependent Clp protease adaptor ClpS [Bacteroidales bacterium]
MKEKTLHDNKKLRKGKVNCSLILFNDEINTFDYVIKSLVEVCGHDSIQAEQCAIMVHYKGSYEVKTGPEKILTSMSNSLNLRGLRSKVKS